ncbi:hypothetical protein [Krasilnikovia sp. MM14-A1259]|uniref:hypothetical protein n=1 Tax=Krasilnikovia sp. MM14-A1259 TaxID=3373539 RepID=UPI00399CE280
MSSVQNWIGPDGVTANVDRIVICGKEHQMWLDWIHAGWARLPEATIALRFATALIGFVIAVPVLAHRVRRWVRRRR